MNTTQIIEKKFNNLFGNLPELVIKSPGRVNLIGEHTDYNEGWVLPASIDKCSTILLRKNELEYSRAYAYDLDEYFEFKLEQNQEHDGWKSYILGVTMEMLHEKNNIGNFDVLITGNVPFGAGMSSSASIECALAFGLNELFQNNFSRKELAHLTQMAEHHFVGVKCGIMDQFTSLLGKNQKALFLDCKTLEHEYIPLELGDYILLLCNTNVSHSLASSEYNVRREQCEEGVKFLQKLYPNILSLRNVNEKMLEKYQELFEEIIYQRCLYVVQENERVKKAKSALQYGKIQILGKYMYKSHQGLSTLYDVSCEELDFLVEATKNNSQILGSRMMGGGFGGCTINIIHKNEVDPFIEQISPKYLEKFGKEMTPYIVQLGDGARIIENQIK